MKGNIAGGKHPVVLFSHGMGGTFRSLGWLAERGAIVVALDHSHTSWNDFDMHKGVRHWIRLQDLGVALDDLMANPDFSGHIDPSCIMAAGFSWAAGQRCRWGA